MQESERLGLSFYDTLVHYLNKGAELDGFKCDHPLPPELQRRREEEAFEVRHGRGSATTRLGKCPKCGRWLSLQELEAYDLR